MTTFTVNIPGWITEEHEAETAQCAVTRYLYDLDMDYSGPVRVESWSGVQQFDASIEYNGSGFSVKVEETCASS